MTGILNTNEGKTKFNIVDNDFGTNI